MKYFKRQLIAVRLFFFSKLNHNLFLRLSKCRCCIFFFKKCHTYGSKIKRVYMLVTMYSSNSPCFFSFHLITSALLMTNLFIWSNIIDQENRIKSICTDVESTYNYSIYKNKSMLHIPDVRRVHLTQWLLSDSLWYFLLVKSGSYGTIDTLNSQIVLGNFNSTTERRYNPVTIKLK